VAARFGITAVGARAYAEDEAELKDAAIVDDELDDDEGTALAAE
jgi:hypothetical protein